MAQSRLEKVGTIFSRVSALIKAGAMQEENKPLWFDIYKKFPPKYEPRYDRPGSIAPIRKIFYAEDELRARFHREHKNFSAVNLLDNNSVSKTKQFLSIHKQLELDGVPETERYDKAIEVFLSKTMIEKSQRDALREEFVKNAAQTRRRGIVAENIVPEGEIDTKDSDEDSKTKYKPIRLSMEKILKDDISDTKKSE